ncbi:hypothetical protein [Plantactinospora endophytica]|uniref:Uncharacterized protein n=1 Tax=Plantactinospora endophytica TaxID=673535 RepID=A0ABQ4DWV5_9ACTN|nr:hypothetical protein [Plantactinospora endophytica]GIG86937.1 hypothetical protein Pen02_18730 [Plantactinospora endophytica]
MAPTFTIAAMTAKLSALEHQENIAGWDRTPVLYALFSESLLGIHHTVEAVDVPIDESVWRMRHHSVTGMRLPHWVGLQAVCDLLVSRPAPQWLPDRPRHQPYHHLIGFAFVQEGLDTTALDDNPNAEPTRVRALTSCDLNGVVYEIVRVHGASEPTVTVLTDPSPQQRAKVVTACLQRLVSAHCRPTDDARD